MHVISKIDRDNTELLFFIIYVSIIQFLIRRLDISALSVFKILLLIQYDQSQFCAFSHRQIYNYRRVRITNFRT